MKQTVQILETDTIHQEFNARDTLAHILDSIESSMKLYNSRRRQRINAQAERLWYTSLELNNRVTQLLESIEKEEQQRLEEESRKAYLVRKQAALTTGLIATAAILLAIVFSSSYGATSLKATITAASWKKPRKEPKTYWFRVRN